MTTKIVKALEGKAAEVTWSVQPREEETEGGAYCGLQHAHEEKQRAVLISAVRSVTRLTCGQ